MENRFADRIYGVPRSFVREILKVALDHEIISFAGGLPNRDLFPAEELKAAAGRIFQTFGNDVMQYANSEGFTGLREKIAARYLQKKGLKISPEQILITTGSQQGIDLIAKCMLNKGDTLIIEEPSYLAAIQAFSIFRPKFLPVPLSEAGIDIKRLKQAMARKPKMMYVIPAFQNPSGISYTEENRRATAEILDGYGTWLIEDDPYGEIRFAGKDAPSFKKLLPERTILLGTFSKIVAPGFRVGWMVAPEDIMEKLIVAKQAADLHTSYFLQCLIYQYLIDNDIDKHVRKISECYGRHLNVMTEAMKQYFPEGVSHTHPEGGMFIWASLPGNLSTRKLLDLALEDKVIFVPGDVFYIDREETNNMRLNFSCMDDAVIRTGIQRLGKSIKKLLG